MFAERFDAILRLVDDRPFLPADPFQGQTGKLLWRGTLLAVLAICVYLPSLSEQWVLRDDLRIGRELAIHTWAGLLDAWAHPASHAESPGVLLVRRLMAVTIGYGPLASRALALAAHAGAAVALWLLLRRLSVRAAWLVAAVFAVHPLHVTTVAWPGQAGAVLAVLAALVGVGLYLRASGIVPLPHDEPHPEAYPNEHPDEHPDEPHPASTSVNAEPTAPHRPADAAFEIQEHHAPGAWFAVAFAFVLALAISPTIVIFAVFVLALLVKRTTTQLDLRHRIRLLIAGVSALAAFALWTGGRVGAVAVSSTDSVAARITALGHAATDAAAGFIGQSLPCAVAPAAVRQWGASVAVGLALLLLCDVWVLMRSRHRAAVPLLLFPLLLLPILATGPADSLGYTPLAALVRYGADIGFVTLAVSAALLACHRLRGRQSERLVRLTLGVLLVAGLAALTALRAAAYGDDLAVWQQAAALDPAASLPHVELAEIDFARGDAAASAAQIALVPPDVRCGAFAAAPCRPTPQAPARIASGDVPSYPGSSSATLLQAAAAGRR